MKKTPVMALVLSAACLALPATANAAGKPANAENQVSGVGEIWFGYSFLSPQNLPAPAIDKNYPEIGGNLRVNVPAGGALNFQFDLQGETGFVDNTSKNYTGSTLGGAHLSWRDPNQWLLGAFVGVGNGYSTKADTATAWLLGAEGQLYLTDWTLYGQLGYMDADDVDTGTPDAFRNAFFGRGVARYFVDSNVKLQGEFSYANGDQRNSSPVKNMDVYGWGLRYERAMHEMDASLFLDYQGNYYDTEFNAVTNHTLTEHVIKLGLSFAFGIEGQKYIDRQGATLDLPMATRWSAYGVSVLR